MHADDVAEIEELEQAGGFFDALSLDLEHIFPIESESCASLFTPDDVELPPSTSYEAGDKYEGPPVDIDELLQGMLG